MDKFENPKIESEKKRIEAELPSVEYVTKWQYENVTYGGKTQSLKMRLIVELPGKIKKWDDLRKLLIENEVPIGNQRRSGIINDVLTLGGEDYDKTIPEPWKKDYSLSIRTNRITSMPGERITVVMNCEDIPVGTNYAWDKGLVRAVAGYVRLYEEDKRKNEEEKLDAKKKKEEVEKPREYR